MTPSEHRADLREQLIVLFEQATETIRELEEANAELHNINERLVDENITAWRDIKLLKDGIADPSAALQAIGFEKGVAIPKVTDGRRPKYDLHYMSVDESKFFAGEEMVTPIASAVTRMHARRDGRRYTMRNVIENGVRGARVWRVE